MTTAYVFMGIFFALWVIGRILENVLIHNRFRDALAGRTGDAKTKLSFRAIGRLFRSWTNPNERHRSA